MEKIQITIRKKKSSNDIIDLILSVLPCAAFVFSSISCLITDKKSGLFTLTYFFILAYHSLRVYLCATDKNFFGQKRSNEATGKRLWFGKHLHYVIIVLAFMFLGVYPLLFFLSYSLYIIREVVKVLSSELGSRVGDLKKSLDNFAKAVNSNKYLPRIRAGIEILLSFYLFFSGLLTFKGKYFLALIVYFANNILYSLMADDNHKWVYSTANKKINDAVKNNKDVKKVVDQVFDNLVKVKDVAKQIYPIPQNAGEAIGAGLKSFGKKIEEKID